MNQKKRSWDEMKDAMFGTPWSDATLLEVEQEWRRLGQSKNAELYRLARLGWAAEQVGRETLAKHGEDVSVTANEQRAMDAFVLHPAWRK